jgi:hypothetical protein
MWKAFRTICQRDVEVFVDDISTFSKDSTSHMYTIFKPFNPQPLIPIAVKQFANGCLISRAQSLSRKCGKHFEQFSRRGGIC